MILYTTKNPLFVGPHFDVTLRPVFLVGVNWSNDAMGRMLLLHLGPLCFMWWRLREDSK